MENSGNGHKETDISIQLSNLGTVNKNRVTINKGNRQIHLYFSYETIVAVDGMASINDWSMTTGKFLNWLQPNKTLRVPHKEVLKTAQERLKWVLGGGD